jgi:hypothetical protein
MSLKDACHLLYCSVLYSTCPWSVKYAVSSIQVPQQTYICFSVVGRAAWQCAVRLPERREENESHWLMFSPLGDKCGVPGFGEGCETFVSASG